MRKMNRAAVQENDIAGCVFQRDIRVVAVITAAMLLPRFGPVVMERAMIVAENNPQAAISGVLEAIESIAFKLRGGSVDS